MLYLNHDVSLDVILKAFELNLQHGRERLEYDSLLRVLQPISLRLVFVIPVHGFDGDVISEGVSQGLHPFDVQLDV